MCFEVNNTVHSFKITDTREQDKIHSCTSRGIEVLTPGVGKVCTVGMHVDELGKEERVFQNKADHLF